MFRKHISRILLSAAAVTLLAGSFSQPVRALTYKVGLGQTLFPDWNHTYQEQSVNPNIGYKEVDPKSGITIDTKDFEQHITINDQVYEIAGIGSALSDSSLAGGQSVVKVPAYPETGSPEAQAQWLIDYGYLIVAYAPHYHNLGNCPGWYGDDNNHWLLCTECKALVGLNWHQDIDHNGICDVCRHPIVYRKLTVKPCTGGKVTISADKGTVGNRVAVTVKADPGYKLADIRGINNNEIHSVRPCFEDIRGSQYHFFVDVWDVEIQPTFIKE